MSNIQAAFEHKVAVDGADNDQKDDPQQYDSEEEDSDPDDPIVASYDVYLKPEIKEGLKIYVLQFPNRDASQPYTHENNALPSELRIKPDSGMVELDVPINVHSNYDKEKGLKWGGAMNRSELVKGAGQHGLGAGFSIGALRTNTKGLSEEEQRVAVENGLQNFEGAVNRGQALTKQTLGGQIAQRQEHSPQYMIGTIRGQELHLTPVDAIVQMRPQFHHLDALTEQAKLTKGGATAVPARGVDARAVHMTVKTTIDGEEDSQHNMADRIAATQKEAWQRHRWFDENHEKSWTELRHLFVGDGTETHEELKKTMKHLKSGWTDEEYLDEISAPLDAARLSRAKIIRKGKTKAKRRGAQEESADDTSDGEDGEEGEEGDIIAGGGGAAVNGTGDLYDA